MTSGGDRTQRPTEPVPFTPKRDFREALEQGRSDVAAWHRIRGDNIESKWREWAGERLADMARNRETTVSLLGDSDPQLRLAAIALVAEYWPPWHGFAAHTLRLAFEDPESPIRGAALVALILLREHIADPTGYLRELLAELFPLSPAEGARADRMADNIRRFIKTKVDNISRKLAGASLPAMLESRASAESFLTDGDPQLRCAAIYVLKRHWGVTPELARTCEQLLFRDPSLEVRLEALAGLSVCYRHSDDARIGEIVARIVYDESSPLQLRREAYHSLFGIRGMPPEALMKAASPDFQFPQDVDWSFVESFLRRSGTDQTH